MAKNYDDYGYEKSYKKSGSSIVRRVLIVLMLLLAIILIFVLIKGCKNRNSNKVVPKETFNYEEALLTAGKAYFANNADAAPSVPGQCSVVQLQSLVDVNLLSLDKFGNCNVTTTYVRVCVLENASRQYTPWLACIDRNSDTEYGPLAEGNLGQVITDESYTEFQFLPQVVKKGGERYGEVEELWQEEIPYEAYKTLSTTTYYRYRDKLYTWNISNRRYYTSTGEKTKSSDVKEYYPVSPSAGYTLYSDKTSNAYKWYTEGGTKEYYKNEKGVKAPYYEAIGEYKNKGEFVFTAYAYASRQHMEPYLCYVCAPSASSTYVVNQCGKKSEASKFTCGKGSNKEFKYTKRTFYTCSDITDNNASPMSGEVSSTTKTCPNLYTPWTYSYTACDTSKSDVCMKSNKSLDYYYWYKVVNGGKKYYPSGSSTASGEKVYYTEAPVSGAVKDTSTQVNAYKWYKETKSTTTAYTAVAPSGYSTATKTSNYKWSDWSSWSTKNPKVNDGRDRTIETKVKIKLQQILPSTPTGWENLVNEYVTEEELIRLFQNNKYSVNTLEDIANNGQIRYQVKMYIRNKKESY